MLKHLKDGFKSIKCGTWIILAITLIIVGLVVSYIEIRQRTHNLNIWKEFNMNIPGSWTESIWYYILFGIIVFFIITAIALKINASVIYTIKFLYGKEYNSLSTDTHITYRLLHIAPPLIGTLVMAAGIYPTSIGLGIGLLGELINVILFHTCS